MHQLWLFLRLLLTTGLLSIIVACTQSGPQQTSTTPTVDSARLTASAKPYPTDTPTPTPMVANATNVGPVPKNCPLTPPLRPQKISDRITSLVGVSPVWASGGESSMGHLAGDVYSPDGGWPVKVVWEVGPHYNHPVTVRAGSLLTGTLLKWHMTPDEHLTFAPVLDPQHPGHPVSVIGDDWNEWGSEVLIPAAGCYYMEAIWSEGHWRETFAMGL